MSDTNPPAPANKQQAAQSLMGHAMTFFSLIRDYWKGEYREVPKVTIGLLVAAVGYIISPIDLIPDFMLGVGQLDDLAVLAIAMKMINTEITRYLAWKAKGAAPAPNGNGKVIDV